MLPSLHSNLLLLTLVRRMVPQLQIVPDLVIYLVSVCSIGLQLTEGGVLLSRLSLLECLDLSVCELSRCSAFPDVLVLFIGAAKDSLHLLFSTLIITIS